MTRKLLTNADNVAIQMNPSTLWDGLAAFFVAAAGGYVVRRGELEPVASATVLGWWSQFGYDLSKRGVAGAGSGPFDAARPVPAFIAGMRRDYVETVARVMKDM